MGITYTTAPMIVMPGCLQSAENYVREVVSLALPDTAWSLGAQELEAWTLLLRGKTEEALNRSEAATDLRQRLGGFPFVGNDLPLLLSVLYLAAGDIEKARQMTNKLVQYTEKAGLSSKGIDMLYLHAAGRAFALLGQFDEAVIMQQRLAALDSSYLLTKYLSNHLQGLIALLTGRQTDAAAILEEAAKLENKLPIAHVGGSAQLLQARLFMDQGNPENAFAVANPVISEWMIASTPGYVIFDGPAVIPVLRMLVKRKSTGTGTLLHLFSQLIRGTEESGSCLVYSQAPSKVLFELLTPREREVLELLVAGRTNLQISAELFISKETVKSHVAHLMRKLDVNSRVQASIRARELGL